MQESRSEHCTPLKLCSIDHDPLLSTRGPSNKACPCKFCLLIRDGNANLCCASGREWSDAALAQHDRRAGATTATARDTTEDLETQASSIAVTLTTKDRHMSELWGFPDGPFGSDGVYNTVEQ